jgi:pilus assembly protein Flp/PilA
MNILDFIAAQFVALTAPGERSERGATAVEYGLMVTLIAVVIVAAVSAFGVNVSKLFLIPAGVLDGGTP